MESINSNTSRVCSVIDSPLIFHAYLGHIIVSKLQSLVSSLFKSLYGLKPSPRTWFGRFSMVVQYFGMTWNEADHSVYYYHSAQGCIHLIVYVNDIVITINDHYGIFEIKQHLCHHFLDQRSWQSLVLLGIKMPQSKDGMVISQKKDIQEICLLNAKPVNNPLDPYAKLPNRGSHFQILKDTGD